MCLGKDAEMKLFFERFTNKEQQRKRILGVIIDNKLTF